MNSFLSPPFVHSFVHFFIKNSFYGILEINQKDGYKAQICMLKILLLYMGVRYHDFFFFLV